VVINNAVTWESAQGKKIAQFNCGVPALCLVVILRTILVGPDSAG
jgi:hypothetical protein